MCQLTDSFLNTIDLYTTTMEQIQMKLNTHLEQTRHIRQNVADFLVPLLCLCSRLSATGVVGGPASCSVTFENYAKLNELHINAK